MKGDFTGITVACVLVVFAGTVGAVYLLRVVLDFFNQPKRETSEERSLPEPGPRWGEREPGSEPAHGVYPAQHQVMERPDAADEEHDE